MPLADIPFERKGDTVIGNDVWLGYESLITPGVMIGDGAVVAARAAALCRGRRQSRPGWCAADTRMPSWSVLVAGDIDQLEAFAAGRRG